MIKDNRLPFDFKEELKKRYGYDEEFAETLTMCTDDIIEYFGESHREDICTSVLSCKYVIAPQTRIDKTGKRVSSIKSLDEIIEEEGMKGFQSLNGMTSAYVSMPIISNRDGYSQIESVKRVIGLPSTFNPNNPSSYGTLTRETCKLVKSYNDEYVIDGTNLKVRSGLGTATYKISSNGDVTPEKTSSCGFGLANGLDVYDELCITRSSMDSDYEVYGRDNTRIVAGFLQDHLKLSSIIKEAELSGEDATLRDVISPGITCTYEEFIESIDALSKLEDERVKHLHDDAAQKDIQSQIDAHYKSAIAPQTRSLEAHLQSYINSQEIANSGKKL